MAAERVVQDFGRTRWAIIYDNTVNGTNNASEFYEALTWQGGKVVGFYEVEIGQEDFSEVLAGVQPRLPEGIYYSGEAVEGGWLRKQAYEMGMTRAMFLGPPGIQSATFAEYAGESAEGAFCAGTVDPTATMWGRTFVEAYNTRYSEPYEQNGAYAYDSAEILLEAVREAGADREKVIQYITRHDFFGAIGEIHWDPYGQNTMGGMVLYIHEDGEWIDYDSSSYAGGFRELPWE
jgi:branched-chain amino acid transport system substrate-binding protein